MSQSVYSIQLFAIVSSVPDNTGPLYNNWQLFDDVKNPPDGNDTDGNRFCNDAQQVNIIGCSAGKVLHSSFVVHDDVPVG